MATGLISSKSGGRPASKAVARVSAPIKPQAKAVSTRAVGASPFLRPNLRQSGGNKPILRGKPMLQTKSKPATIKSMARPKGTIKGKIASGIKGAIGGGISSLPGIGGALSGAISGFNASGNPIFHKRKKSGLTHNEIKGALKVLRLVKRFAPAGHRTALRVKRHRHLSY